MAVRHPGDHDIAVCAAVTHDHHPLHTDDAFARSMGFPKRIAHGLYGLSLMEGLKNKLRLYEHTSIASLGWDKVRFRHPLDQTADAAAIMDPGPMARPGDEYTVNATGFSADSFDQVSGASYREILDLADWDHSVVVNVPGQSGQPGSPHYDDLLPLWRTGRYFQLAYSRKAVDAVTADVLELKP